MITTEFIDITNFDVDEDERIYVDLNNVSDDESDKKNISIDKNMGSENKQ